MPTQHNTRIDENSNGTYSWSCTCGDEADEFEDWDSADDSAIEHRRDSGTKEA